MMVSAFSGDLNWRQVVSKTLKTKCHTVTKKTGKVILKPMNRETTDILKHLSKVSTLLKEDSLAVGNDAWRQCGHKNGGHSGPHS